MWGAKGGFKMDAQRKIISMALILIILMGVFPPWKQSFKTDQWQHEKPTGYGFIFHPPNPTESAYSLSLDFSRLFLQWGVVILVAGLFCFINKKGHTWKS
jgi:hypothetical protein